MRERDFAKDLERDAEATLVRALKHDDTVNIEGLVTPGAELHLSVEIEESDGTRWTHRYNPDDDGWPSITRGVHARARAITVKLKGDTATTEIATDLAIIEGSFACCDDAMIIVTQGTTLTAQTLAEVLDDAYGTLYARERAGLDIETRESERVQEHRSNHRDIAALAAAQTLAQSPEEAQTERIRLLWDQCIDLPKGVVEHGVYTVTVAAGATQVERRA